MTSERIWQARESRTALVYFPWPRVWAPQPHIQVLCVDTSCCSPVHPATGPCSWGLVIIKSASYLDTSFVPWFLDTWNWELPPMRLVMGSSISAVRASGPRYRYLTVKHCRRSIATRAECHSPKVVFAHVLSDNPNPRFTIPGQALRVEDSGGACLTPPKRHEIFPSCIFSN